MRDRRARFNATLRVCAIGVAMSAAMAIPAGASTLHATKPYSAFGNLSGVGDCQYESAANLVLSRWPKARITTAEVESAYDKFGAAFEGQSVTSDGGSTWTLEGLWAGQNYLIDHGFAGHRARAIIEVTTKASMVAAANSGGLEVVNNGPVRQHVFDITAATATHVTIVDDGFVYHYTWSWLNWAYTQDGETLTFYAVKWSA